MSFTKATKSKAKLRLAVFGPSGSGKTYTALEIATGLGGKIALIDTERGSASKYADRFDFDVCDLDVPTIENYTAMISEAKGYNVLIIDSMSHAWQELLEQVDVIAKQKYRGNTWSAWSDGTPKQRSFVDAILSFPGHVIATMRSKTEWATEKDEKSGKNKPVRIGLAPEQGKGIEYEFDMLMEMSINNYANVIKDRTGKYQDTFIEKPSRELGKALAAWLNEGKDVAPKPVEEPKPAPVAKAKEAPAKAASPVISGPINTSDVPCPSCHAPAGKVHTTKCTAVKE